MRKTIRYLPIMQKSLPLEGKAQAVEKSDLSQKSETMCGISWLPLEGKLSPQVTDEV